MGVAQWQVALRAAGADPFEALKFIQFVMNKIRAGILAATPRLRVRIVTRELEIIGALPQPWELDTSQCGDSAAESFGGAATHVGGSGEEQRHMAPKSSNSVFGNIYPFRALFDEREVAGCQLQVGSPGENNKEYIRFVDREGLINMVLVECLNRIPVYFINMAGKEDKVAQWILQQPSVYPGE